MKKQLQKLSSILLCFVMLIGLLPTTVFAASTGVSESYALSITNKPGTTFVLSQGEYTSDVCDLWNEIDSDGTGELKFDQSFILAATNFDVRLTNKLLPGYGKLSAGAGFAFIVEFGFFTIAQGIANLLAIACSNPLNSEKLQKLRFIVQDIILPIICIIIFLIVVYLEFTMPTWKSIYQSTNY